MAKEIIEKILTDILQIYMNYDESVIDELLKDPNLVKKELVEKKDGLKVMIYPLDHDPPYFHVTTKDKKIDAKFFIETGEYISGKIDSRNLKTIKAYYNSPKTKKALESVWKKRL